MAKPNERRKRTNWMRRVVRGNLKAGNPLPGQSRVYSLDTLDAGYTSHGESLRGAVDDALRGYWPEEHRAPRTPNPSPRWF